MHHATVNVKKLHAQRGMHACVSVAHLGGGGTRAMAFSSRAFVNRHCRSRAASTRARCAASSSLLLRVVAIFLGTTTDLLPTSSGSPVLRLRLVA
jgi:hypothetical protein